MKKRVLCTLCSLFVLGGIFLNVSVNVNAEGMDSTGIIVDGSLLTHDDFSTGTSSNPVLRGEHLMDGQSAISKAGNGRIYAYGQTTADHDVDRIAVLMFVERLNEDEKWEHVNGYVEDARNTYYVIVDDTLKVKRGYYYRVRCEHMAGNDDEETYDEAFSVTNGIMIP